MFDALADDERLAVELDARRTGLVGHDELAEPRHHSPSCDAETVRVHRHLAPGDDPEALVVDDALDRRLGFFGSERLDGQERQPDGVAPGGRQRFADLGAKEAVGHLDEDPGAVARVGLCPGRPAVVEIGQRGQGGVDELAADDALQVGDERHAARVVLEAGVVETVPHGCLGKGMLHSVVVLVHESRSGRLGWVPGTTLARTVNRQSRGSRIARTVLVLGGPRSESATGRPNQAIPDPTPPRTGSSGRCRARRRLVGTRWDWRHRPRRGRRR